MMSDQSTPAKPQRPGLAPIVVAVLMVATATVAVVVARSIWHPGAAAGGPTCSAPSLPGSTLDVTLADMGGMMAGRMPTWTNGGLMPGSGTGMMGGTSSYGRVMSVLVSPSSVTAGEVSFRVWNAGTIVHELVVMPMAAGGAGSRAVGSDGKVSESGSLGEASQSCGKGAGEGIESGAVGWVTLHLTPGRYELICNIAGHYAMGMFNELTVT